MKTTNYVTESKSEDPTFTLEQALQRRGLYKYVSNKDGPVTHREVYLSLGTSENKQLILIHDNDLEACGPFTNNGQSYNARFKEFHGHVVLTIDT